MHHPELKFLRKQFYLFTLFVISFFYLLKPPPLQKFVLDTITRNQLQYSYGKSISNLALLRQRLYSVDDFHQSWSDLLGHFSLAHPCGILAVVYNSRLQFVHCFHQLFHIPTQMNGFFAHHCPKRIRTSDFVPTRVLFHKHNVSTIFTIQILFARLTIAPVVPLNWRTVQKVPRHLGSIRIVHSLNTHCKIKPWIDILFDPLAFFEGPDLDYLGVIFLADFLYVFVSANVLTKFCVQVVFFAMVLT